MTKALEFYYDFSCPYAYLASTRVERIAEGTGAELIYKPFLLGGVFRAQGNATDGMLRQTAARARLNGLDMQRFAELFDVPLQMPATHPNRTVLALRATLASGDVPRATHALFAAYWRAGQDLSEPSIVREALDAVGLDGSAAVAGAEAVSVKDDLRARTAEAVDRGVFGAPACFVGDTLFWGQDRLGFVAEALGGDARLLSLIPPPAPPQVAREVEFFFDYSSPFAYLASTQIEREAAAVGARVVLRPFLLGALFKSLGGADVPMLEFSESKRAWVLGDLMRHADRYGVPFRFPSQFPIRSVLPLRVTLAAGDAMSAVMHALFRAAWVEDRDIAEPDVVRAVLEESGQPSSLVDRAGDATHKDELRRLTALAESHGLCGAPSFLVDGHLFWGQDRLELVRRAMLGWKPRAG